MPSSSPSWWAALKHGGLLIAPSKLAEFFPEVPAPMSAHLAERLRRDLVRLEVGGAEAEGVLLETILERVCGLEDAVESRWHRGSEVPREWSFRTLTGETVRPRRLWEGPRGALLPVFVDGEGRLGVGRGRRAVSRVIEWLRGKEQPIALLTNGRQWRLIHAGLDYEAWAEWDTDLWFEEGHTGAQVDALRTLLSVRALTPPRPTEPALLLAAILDSRRGQAELSTVLGERVRQAVELLIQSHGPALEHFGGALAPEEIYRAAARVVMRMIVVLFAEARELLPRDNPVYHGSYGLEGLREALDRVGTGAGAERLRHRFGAWPRVLALFRLVFEGSHHPELPVPRYGGGLFEPGAAAAQDPLFRALAVFEDPQHAPSDFHVRGMIELLTRSRVRVRQGAGSTWVEAPVDFSDLSSEYIGILYEGLLDYELRRAGPDDPYVLLALGDEPTLPLRRLEAMEEEALKNLVAKALQRRRPVVATEEEGEDDEDAVEEDGEAADEAEPRETAEQESTVEEVSASDERQRVRDRAHAWAVRAVTVARLVPPTRAKQAQAKTAYETAVAAAARDLVPRTILPGEWFLVRWGGTRKGSGTFYTRPQLAVPTVHRALRPLAYDPPGAAEGRRDEDAPPAAWIPKSPEDILRLKVCDPAMGSGSFLVASLRFLTGALYASLFHHGWLAREDGHLVVVVGEGRPLWFLEAVRDMPLEADEAERYLHARLRRHVVERCLYGVDLDPLAVELGRLALWIETMDWSLPFGFLDHKLKVGNSLVGCWFDEFQDYPAMAWDREGGDKGHSRGVHFEDGGWTRAIKQFGRQQVAPAVVSWLDRQGVLFQPFEGQTPDDLHAEAVALFEALHALPIHDTEGRAAFYREKILRSPALARLKEAFDTWCAIWFWPATALDSAPLPLTFARPPDEMRAVLARLVGEHRFFHWELEFPDVFAAPGSGFDAVLGNPPWEIQKPNSREFFSSIDPLYRTYGKQEALRRQQEGFRESQESERAWLYYCARLKALSNWSALAHAPWGDPADESTPNFNPFKGKGSKTKAAQFHDKWRRARASRRGYADPEHPYRHQGSADINTYKMFLEQAHALLRPGGTLAMIAPSGLYTDKGSTDLRTLFLERCRWRWLFGFENREKVFDIDSRFKFGPVIVQKGGTTDAIRTAFMRRQLRDWTEAERHVIPYTRAQIERFSPLMHGFLEVGSERDIGVLTKVFASRRVVDSEREAWGLSFTTEIHKTNDSKLLRSRPWMEANHLLSGGDDPREVHVRVKLLSEGYAPVWEGKNCHFESWPSAPQSFIQVEEAKGWIRGTFPFGVRRIARNTDERTLIGCVVPPLTPTMYTIEVCRGLSLDRAMFVYAIMTSLVIDFVIRFQVSSSVAIGNLESLPLPHPNPELEVIVGSAVRRLFGPRGGAYVGRRALVDALVAELYGLDFDDLLWILRDCDHPVANLRDRPYASGLDSKGFWRVDKDKDPELRHTVLTLAAFRDLRSMIAMHGSDRELGIEGFCTQNGGDGWMVPEALCLDDLGLGHDERAKRAQPVRERLGERFNPWQIEQSIEESWAECERHARNLLGAEGFAQLQAELRGESLAVQEAELGRAAEVPAPYRPGAPGSQHRLFPRDPDLFGERLEDPPRRRKPRRGR